MKNYFLNLFRRNKNNIYDNLNTKNLFRNTQNGRDFYLKGNQDSLNSYINFVYIAVCCDTICRDVVRNSYYFSDLDGNKIEQEKIDDQLMLPFKNGFYNNDFLEIIQLTLYHRLLTGNAYLRKDSITAFSAYNNSYDHFVPIFPNEIQPVLSQDKKQLLHYKLNLKDGSMQILDIDEVIHFKQNAIYNPFLGVGNITKMRLLAEGELAGQVFNNEFLTNKAFPSVIFSDETSIRPGDYERISELIQNRFKASNGKAFYVNGTNFKIHQLNPSYQDMQFLEQKKYNEEAIYELFGCYKLTETTNRATAEIKRLRYLENTINPIIAQIEKTINHQYMFKHREKKDILFKMERYTTGDVENIIKMVSNGIITPNRASELLGEDFDIKNYERNVFYMPANLIPMGIVPENLDDSENKEEDKKNHYDYDNFDLNNPKNINQILGYTFKHSRKNKYFQTKYLRRALTTRNKMEDKHILLLKKFFKKQKNRVIENINEHYSSLKNIEFDKKYIYNNENLNIFFSLKNEDKYIKKYVSELHEQTIEDAVEDVNRLVKTNISHSDSVMWHLKDSLGSLIVGPAGKNNINKYTQKRVYNAIIYSINNNLSINEVQHELSNIFKSFESYRTRRIARTETRAAWDAAASETYKELDVRRVDVVGCTQFEPDSDCGKKGILLTEVLNLKFHPNHIGALAPEIEP